MQDLRISFIQDHLFWKDDQANIAHFEQKINAIDQDTDLIVLPEMFNTGFVVQPQEINKGVAENSLKWLQKMAAQKNTFITASMIVQENSHYYNRLYWVAPNKSFQYYDKRHLFSLGNEHLRFTAGEESLIVELKGWKIKPLICYDLRFPVWAKNNYSEGNYDYDLLIYIANWPKARAYAWKSLLVARAIENQSYVLGVNRIGNDGNGTPHAGFSGLIEPKGEWVSKEAENIASVQTNLLSAENLQEYRKKFTVGLDWDKFQLLKKPKK